MNLRIVDHEKCYSFPVAPVIYTNFFNTIVKPQENIVNHGTLISIALLDHQFIIQTSQFKVSRRKANLPVYRRLAFPDIVFLTAIQTIR